MIPLSILILSLPLIWELWSERKGEDPKKKGRSMTVRAALMIVCSCVSAIIHDYAEWGNGDYLDGLLTFAKSLFLSFAIFFLTFDYLINIIFHKKTRVWYSYLSESPLDRLWSGWNWRLRLAIRVAVFAISLTIFLWN